MELISIIVPVYKTGQFLSKCLDSLINQTYKNIEIIIVNDGSPDNAITIAEEYAKKDSRIVVLSQRNRGLSAARNYGIIKSKGEYIGFVDSDDYIEDKMYDYLYKMIKKGNSKIAICGWYVVKDSIKKCDYNQDYITVNSKEATNLLLNHISFDNFACNKLFHRSLFHNIRFPEGRVLEDLLTTWKLIHIADKISIDSKPLYYYVLHSNSITSILYNQLNEKAYEAFEERRNQLLECYPSLKNKINSNFFIANKSYFIISLKSNNRSKRFEKARIKNMRKYIVNVWGDSSIPKRVKLSSTLITIFPNLYFKLRGLD